MKKAKRLLFVFLIVLMVGFLAACGGKGKENEDGMDEEALENLNEKDLPIDKDEITLKFFTAKSDISSKIDWNKLPVWDKYKEMTNINVDWSEQVHMDSLAEKRNLALGGGNIPDAFFAADISNTDLFKYGEQGTFIKLNDLIDKY